VAVLASFQYDAFDRRIARTDASGVTTAYLYDGGDAVQEVSDGSARTSLVGQNIDERFARDDTTGKTYFLTDALGSTIALTDAAANVKQGALKSEVQQKWISGMPLVIVAEA